MKTIGKMKQFVFYIALLFLSATVSIIKNNADLDLWHRMAVGKIFSQTGTVMFHDIFTYFPAKALWVDHEWLSGVIFYNLTHYFGDYGILALKILCLFGILFFIYKTNQLIFPEPGKHRISYYLIALIAICIGLIATLRCQAFTYLFFTLWIYVLERVRRGENRLIWIFPATTLLWANMHAGFIAGFGLIIFYAVGEFLNGKSFMKYAGILALCLPVTLINPYGIKYWYYLIEATTMERPYITEWEPLRPFEKVFTIIGTKIQLLFLIPAVIYRIFSKDENKLAEKSSSSKFCPFCFLSKKFDWVEIIAFFTTLYLAVNHNRHVLFFSIILAVFGYKYFAMFMNVLLNKISLKLLNFVPEQKRHLVHFGKFTLIYGLIIGFSLMMFFSEPYTVKLADYPVKAVEFIKINNLKGNLLIPFNWGSYAMWKLYPQNLVSIDGRYEETYTNKAYLDVSAITFYQRNWKKVFYEYRHDILLMYKDADIEKALQKLKDWKIIYENEVAVVFVPASFPEKKFLLPPEDEQYYIKTKYENNIDFIRESESKF